MKTLTWILIAITVAGAALDIYTTEALLGTGQYYEQNGLYYVLGNTGFLAFFISLTVAACLVIMYIDQLCQRESCKPKTFTRALTLLSCYALLHWYLGVNQLIQVINMIRGA